MYCRQKIHFDHFHTGSFAGLTPAPFDIKGEPARLVTSDFGFRKLGKQRANVCKHPCVGGWARAGCSANRRLVYLYHLVNVSQSCYAGVGEGGNSMALVEVSLQHRVKCFVYERRFATARYSGDTHELTQWDEEVYVFEVVTAATFDSEVLALSFSSVSRERYLGLTA